MVDSDTNPRRRLTMRSRGFCAAVMCRKAYRSRTSAASAFAIPIAAAVGARTAGGQPGPAKVCRPRVQTSSRIASLVVPRQSRSTVKNWENWQKTVSGAKVHIPCGWPAYFGCSIACTRFRYSYRSSRRTQSHVAANRNCWRIISNVVSDQTTTAEGFAMTS